MQLQPQVVPHCIIIDECTCGGAGLSILSHSAPNRRPIFGEYNVLYYLNVHTLSIHFAILQNPKQNKELHRYCACAIVCVCLFELHNLQESGSESV